MIVEAQRPRLSRRHIAKAAGIGIDSIAIGGFHRVSDRGAAIAQLVEHVIRNDGSGVQILLAAPTNPLKTMMFPFRLPT